MEDIKVDVLKLRDGLCLLDEGHQATGYIPEKKLFPEKEADLIAGKN